MAYTVVAHGVRGDDVSMGPGSSLPGTMTAYRFLLVTSKVTAPQDAHRRLVLQVYLGSNTLELSSIRR